MKVTKSIGSFCALGDHVMALPPLVLFLSLIWPSVSPGSILFGWAFIFSVCAAFTFDRKVSLNALYYCIFIFAIFFALSFFQFIRTGWIGECGDLARFLPIFAAFVMRDHISLGHVRAVFFLVLLLNLLAILAVEYNVFKSSIEYLYTRTFEESYGRHAGVFLNVSTLTLFGQIGVLISILSMVTKLDGSFIGNAIILIGSLFLIVASGGKTPWIALLLTLPFLPLLHMKKPILGLGLLLCGIMLFIGLHFFGLIYVHSVQKLINGFVFGLDALSSVGGRFEIWRDFFAVWWGEPINVLLGVPKAVSQAIGNTYDSDAVWLLFRYGVLGAGVFYLIVLYALWSSFRWRDVWCLPFLSLLISSLAIGVMLAFQMSFLFWLILFKCCFSNQVSNKFVREDV